MNYGANRLFNNRNRSTMKTTLNLIKVLRPSHEDLSKLAEFLGPDFNPDEKFPVETVVENFDTKLSLYALHSSPDRGLSALKFVHRCASRVLYIYERSNPTDTAPRRGLKLIEDVIEDPFTLCELYELSRDVYRSGYSAYQYAYSDGDLDDESRLAVPMAADAVYAAMVGVVATLSPISMLTLYPVSGNSFFAAEQTAQLSDDALRLAPEPYEEGWQRALLLDVIRNTGT